MRKVETASAAKRRGESCGFARVLEAEVKRQQQKQSESLRFAEQQNNFSIAVAPETQR